MEIESTRNNLSFKYIVCPLTNKGLKVIIIIIIIITY